MSTAVTPSSLTIDSILTSPDQKIHLPTPINGNLKEAAKILLKIDEESTKAVSFVETFPGFHPGDTGVCFMRLLRSTYGFVSMEGMKSFFGTKPPLLYNIATGPLPTDVEPMVFGDLKVPGLGESVSMSISINWDTGTPCLEISGSCQNRHLAGVRSLLADLRRQLPTLSIYRGRAVRVSWAWQRNKKDYSITDHAPQFLDLSRSNFSSIVFSETTSRQVAANLFLPITTPRDKWVAAGFPRKAGVLMQGPPGCGKTETLLQVANLCTAHGWTYIQCSSADDVEAATHMALSYQPAVVAVEDIDKAAQGRDTNVDALLNIIDGTETKNRDILFVATTNNVDSITDAMLRPGRLGDGFIHMGPPDETACDTLIRRLAGNSLLPGEDLTPVCATMAGALPAVIAATVSTARRYALQRTSLTSDTIQSSDLLAAFAERSGQIALLTRPTPDTRSPAEKAASILASCLGSLSTSLSRSAN